MRGAGRDGRRRPRPRAGAAGPARRRAAGLRRRSGRVRQVHAGAALARGRPGPGRRRAPDPHRRPAGRLARAARAGTAACTTTSSSRWRAGHPARTGATTGTPDAFAEEHVIAPMDLLVLDGVGTGHPSLAPCGRRWSGSRPSTRRPDGARAGARRRGDAARVGAVHARRGRATSRATTPARRADLRVRRGGTARAAISPRVWGCFLRPVTSSRSRAAATAPS